MARTGKEYLAAIAGEREVWLNGEKVADVTRHPELRNAAELMASLYDLQHEASDRCLVKDPDTGEPMSATHLIPKSREDLERRHVAIETIAKRTLGIMGRSPDYMNVMLAGHAGRPDVWAANGNERGAENLIAFQKEVRKKDLALTHALINATVDAGADETAAVGGTIALHKVSTTDRGIIVRGARALATLAPFSDEILIYPVKPMPPDSQRHVLAFSVPVGTPGVKLMCRDSYSLASNAYDHPFSTSFDEQDSFVIFDDVEVPHNRVFLDGNVEVANKIGKFSNWPANVMQQSTIRALAKLEFAYDLATRMVEAVNGVNAGTVELLGEISSYVELTRAALRAAEVDAHEYGSGTWFCADEPFRALRPTLPKWFPRVNDILKQLGAHNLLTTPTLSELENPALRPLLEHFYQGAKGVSAEDRVLLYRIAWDFVGTSLASRNELYERYYLASARTGYTICHMVSSMKRDRSMLDRLLATGKAAGKPRGSKS